MNYPIWELTTLGGGSLIALIAVLHVYISHLAVGGGLFIWLTDLKAYREKDKDLNGYVQKHSRFFLLLTMVFGGVTGVGIWFIIALVHPAATSLLIHNFVFGWAIEWVFFLGEIFALLVYVYHFDRLERKHRLNVAFFYFLYAWLSLVVINGILAFMLTPGDWLQTQNFWDGFFNPTYFPSLFFRTFMTMLIAGLFGFVTSVFLVDESFRMKMMRYCAKWLLFPLAGLVPSAWWYYAAIPQSIQNTAFILNPQTNPVITLLVVTTILIFVIGIILSLRVAAGMQKALTFLLLLIGLGWMGGFEYSREIARKPFVISDVMYSTAIAKTDPVITQQASLLMAAKWSPIKEITEKNKIEAGKELFNLQCLGCHTLNGIRNDLVEQTKEFTYLGLLALLSGQGKVQTYMPPFAGTEQEKEALAGYLAALQDKDWKEEPETVITSDNSVEIPPYDFNNDEYVLLVWNDKGMQFISDADQWFSLMPPGNTLEALLIRRGEVPELVTEDVYLSYEVASGYKNPSQQVKFWEYTQATFNQQPEKNVGLQGKGLSGRFDFDEMRNGYIAAGIPVVPYKDDGSFNPYPLFTVRAHDAKTDEVLITTMAVAPVSTELGCMNCHGGTWKHAAKAGLSDQTAINILKTHDRMSRTDLYDQARGGQPKACQSCHTDSEADTTGNNTHLNLSAAMHGLHANYMPLTGNKACTLCHANNPGDLHRVNRGIHGFIGKTCLDCHGTLNDHALALLKGEARKPGSAALAANLTTNLVDDIEEINPRKPWRQEPDCLTCHEDFAQPENETNAFNQWNEEPDELYRLRKDDGGIRCQACHHSMHALYPSRNPFGKDLDNIQPLQYTGKPLPIGSDRRCETCHIIKMEDPIHHDNMDRMFRNRHAFE